MPTPPSSALKLLDELTALSSRHPGQQASAEIQARPRTGDSVGGAPVGYWNICGGKDTRVELDPVLAPLIRELFRFTLLTTPSAPR